MKIDYNSNMVQFDDKDESKLENYMPCIRTVIHFLFLKSRMEQQKQDINNKTVINGVSFWLTYPDGVTDEKQQLYFDKVPSQWNIENIVKEVNYKTMEYEKTFINR